MRWSSCFWRRRTHNWNMKYLFYLIQSLQKQFHFCFGLKWTYLCWRKPATQCQNVNLSTVLKSSKSVFTFNLTEHVTSGNSPWSQFTFIFILFIDNIKTATCWCFHSHVYWEYLISHFIWLSLIYFHYIKSCIPTRGSANC